MIDFSVVMCTFNRADRVSKAIQSVLDQTFSDFELIVVDDGSVDDTQAAVEAIHDPRIRYVFRPNGGLSAARNTGVAIASARYVTFLDDDDQAMPQWLERFIVVLAGDDAVATSAADVVDVRGRLLKTIPPFELGPAYDNYRALFLSGTFALPRQGYLDIGGFAEGGQSCEHAEFALRLLPFCRRSGWPVRVIEEPLLRYEARPTDERHAAQPAMVLTGMEYVLTEHHERVSRAPHLLANCHARAGVAAARLGRYSQARRHFGAAAHAQPRKAKHWLRLGLAVVPPLGDAVWKARRHGHRGAPSRHAL